MCEWNENFDNEETIDDIVETERFESSFTYHAVPLDKLETIGDDGIVYSIKEMMDLKDLREELGE